MPTGAWQHGGERQQRRAAEAEAAVRRQNVQSPWIVSIFD